MPWRSATRAQSLTAVICGTPTPATTRVVQMLPGPMPTFTRVDARVDERLGRLGRRDVAGDDLARRELLLRRAHRVDDALRVAVRRVDDDDVDPRGDERRGALVPVRPRADGRADAQAPLLVLVRLRVLVGLKDVLDGDEARRACPARRRRGASRCGACGGGAWPRRRSRPGGTVTSSFVISALTGWSRFCSKRMSRAVRMPTGRSPSTTGTPLMSCSRMTSSAARSDCDGRAVTGAEDHPALGALHALDLARLRLDGRGSCAGCRCRPRAPS